MSERGARYLSSPRISKASADRAIVGITLFHGTSDRDTAAAQIDTQLYGLVQSVLTAMGADSSLVLRDPSDKTRITSDPKWAAHVIESRDAILKSPYRALWDDAVSPTWNEWASFYHSRRHWYDELTERFTSWEDYTSWFDRVEALRNQIAAAGIKIAVPPLHSLHKSAQETAEDITGTLLKIVKYVAIGGAVLGGAFIIVEVVQAARK